MSVLISIEVTSSSLTTCIRTYTVLNSPLQVGVCICAPFRSRTVATISASVTPSSTSVQIKSPPLCDFDNSDNNWYGQLHTYVCMYVCMYVCISACDQLELCWPYIHAYTHTYVVASSQCILGMCVHLSMLWAHVCDEHVDSSQGVG